MFKRFFAVMLASFVLLSALGIQPAGAQTSSDQATEKIRAKIQKIGVGTNAMVEVKLRDNSQMRGYITESNQDSFTMFDKNSGSTKTVSYRCDSSKKIQWRFFYQVADHHRRCCSWRSDHLVRSQAGSLRRWRANARTVLSISSRNHQQKRMPAQLEGAGICLCTWLRSP